MSVIDMDEQPSAEVV
jgi:hypothetical protein